MSEIDRTLILALGNSLRGDDGAGAAVLRCLEQQPLPPGVTLLDAGTPGLELALLWQGYQQVIVIDAADIGREPGEWAAFTPNEVQLESGKLLLLHDAGLAEALKLGAALDVLPPRIVIYGIQPQEIGWTAGLSAAVEAAVPRVAQAILKILS